VSDVTVQAADLRGNSGDRTVKETKECPELFAAESAGAPTNSVGEAAVASNAGAEGSGGEEIPEALLDFLGTDDFDNYPELETLFHEAGGQQFDELGNDEWIARLSGIAANLGNQIPGVCHQGCADGGDDGNEVAAKKSLRDKIRKVITKLKDVQLESVVQGNNQQADRFKRRVLLLDCLADTDQRTSSCQVFYDRLNSNTTRCIEPTKTTLRISADQVADAMDNMNETIKRDKEEGYETELWIKVPIHGEKDGDTPMVKLGEHDRREADDFIGLLFDGRVALQQAVRVLELSSCSLFDARDPSQRIQTKIHSWKTQWKLQNLEVLIGYTGEVIIDLAIRFELKILGSVAEAWGRSERSLAQIFHDKYKNAINDLDTERKRMLCGLTESNRKDSISDWDKFKPLARFADSCQFGQPLLGWPIMADDLSARTVSPVMPHHRVSTGRTMGKPSRVMDGSRQPAPGADVDDSNDVCETCGLGGNELIICEGRHEGAGGSPVVVHQACIGFLAEPQYFFCPSCLELPGFHLRPTKDGKDYLLKDFKGLSEGLAPEDSAQLEERWKKTVVEPTKVRIRKNPHYTEYVELNPPKGPSDEEFPLVR
jgi:hypothetical protein